MVQDQPPGRRVNHASGTIEIAGKTVHRLGFGAMRLVGPGVWGEPADRGHPVRLVRRAVELGVDFIDTASVYGPHISEEIIREALRPYPEQVLITTKGGQTQSGPGAYATLGRPEYLRQECVLSLRRLGVDRIDLYQLHQVDPLVPFEDQIGELMKLKEEGKIGAIGLNEVSVEQVVAARRMTEIASVQNQYSITERKHEDVLDHCTREGLPFISWFPLDIGALAGPDSRIGALAARIGATPAQVALAWLLARAENMVPIPGTSSTAHLEENVGAATVRLSAAQLTELNALADRARS